MNVRKGVAKTEISGAGLNLLLVVASKSEAVLRERFSLSMPLPTMKNHFNILGLCAVFASLAGAANAQDVRVELNGRPFRTQVAPVTENGRVLVPMRAIFEGLGATVEFDSFDQSIVARRRGTVVRMTLGRRRALVNNQPVRLDVTPVAALGRTLVPLRFVSEALGARVNYNSNLQLVSIDENRRPARDRDRDGVPNGRDVYPNNPRR